MAPPEHLDGGFATTLFDVGQPSNVAFNDQAAFRHYLDCLHKQAAALVQDTFDETVAACEDLLGQAERLLERLAAGAIRGQERDFTDVVDVNRAALALFTSLRGPTMRRSWAQLRHSSF